MIQSVKKYRNHCWHLLVFHTTCYNLMPDKSLLGNTESAIVCEIVK